MLASAAIGSSRTVGELIPAAVETVVVSLRLGLCVLRVRDLVDHSSEKSQSWSLVVSGINEEKAGALLSEFCQRKVDRAPILSIKHTNSNSFLLLHLALTSAL